MYKSTSIGSQFTIIDLDPYGGPNRFLDSAIQAIEDGGLLLVTATDMAVFAGNTPEACIVKYGVVPLRSKACHEMGLRILLRVIEAHANRYGRYIQPLISLSIDFYIRVFVRVFTGQFQSKMSATKQSMVHQCTGCDTITFQPLAIRKVNKDNPNSMKFSIPTGPFVQPHCEHCNHRHHMGGPMWSDPIHDGDFLGKLMEFVRSEKAEKLGTHARLVGMLSVVQEELLDIPLYYRIDSLCCTLKVEAIPQMKLRSVLLTEGYKVSLSHACKNSLKTNAPMNVIWDILRSWVKKHPINPTRMHDQSPLTTILAKEPTKEYDFNKMHPDANPPSRQEALARYPLNPAAMWGPGTRATLM
jgi:tRNA (guanine26-N2/guanine27-N2)-dimethyltransferase